MYKMKSKLLNLALGCGLLFGCAKIKLEEIPENVNQPAACDKEPKWNNGAVCKGRITTPSLGVIYYSGLKRSFRTSGPNSIDTDTKYINQAGDTIVMPAVIIRLTVDFITYYLYNSGAPGNAVVFDPIPPGVSRFDTCTGILYLKYSWTNHTREVCDTCVFL